MKREDGKSGNDSNVYDDGDQAPQGPTPLELNEGESPIRDSMPFRAIMDVDFDFLHRENVPGQNSSTRAAPFTISDKRSARLPWRCIFSMSMKVLWRTRRKRAIMLLPSKSSSINIYRDEDVVASEGVGTQKGGQSGISVQAKAR